jgi:hypothetical protein
MVYSIQVACLLAHYVHLGSLAKLLLAYHWQGDAINAYHLGFKVNCNT